MFSIVAELPLGTYRGRSRDGRPERLPSVARLHSALLCAAGFGGRAVREAEEWQPCEADREALRWLEEHPPDGVHIPALEVGPGRAVAYRDDGTLKKSKGSLATKKLSKMADETVAVGGRFVWTWQQAPPLIVRDAFTELCGDVPYLGTSESPVRLQVVEDTDVDLTHERDIEADVFTVGTTPVEHPLPGRTAELITAHARAGAAPTIAKDKHGTDEKSLSLAPVRAVKTVLFRPRAQPSNDVPWSQVVLLPVGRAVAEKDRVRWAVAVHKALVAAIGEGAPSVITGTYADGDPRPANRVAVHFLDAGAPVAGNVLQGRPALAVLLPHDVGSPDSQALFGALGQLRQIRGPNGRVMQVDPEASVVLAGARFWREPSPDDVRWWHTVPAAVPDNRGTGDQDWTFAQAALLSLAFVWKDLLPPVPGRRAAYWRAMAAAVADRGASVGRVSVVRNSEPGRYVHRVHHSAVVRPYEAWLSLGEFVGTQTVQAIGQSRHLGGGLLLPHDVRREQDS